MLPELRYGVTQLSFCNMQVPTDMLKISQITRIHGEHNGHEVVATVVTVPTYASIYEKTKISCYIP